MPTLTVADLIRELQRYPPDMLVGNRYCEQGDFTVFSVEHFEPCTRVYKTDVREHQQTIEFVTIQ